MSVFKSFLGRFSPEYRALGQAVLTLAAGIALQPREREQVQAAADTIISAADNIEKSLKTLKDAAPSKADVKAAVKEALPGLLPDLLAGLVETEVRKRLEAANQSS